MKTKFMRFFPKVPNTTLFPFQDRLRLGLILLAGIVGLISSSVVADGQTLLDSFTDGNFTSGPAWSGDAANWTMAANSDVAAGAVGSRTLRLNAPALAQTDYLQTQISDWGGSQEWGIWIGIRAQALTAGNSRFVWLYANEATLTSATVDGYRLAMGDDSGGDEIRLQRITDGVATTVITSAGAIVNALTDIGFLVRVTRSNAGEWNLYTSVLPTASGTGDLATDSPISANASVIQGTATDTAITPSAGGYFGLSVSHTTGANAIVGTEFDQVYFTATPDCTPPTATVSGDATICDGGLTTIQAVLTGTGPWDVTWSDSVTQTGVATSPATRNVTPATTTNYTVTSVSDASGCAPGTGTGSATVTVNQPVTPSVSITANPGTTTCAGSQVVFTAVPVQGGVTPTYVWKTNGVADGSVPNTSATYTNSSLSNGETIDCQLTSSLSCVTASTAEAPQLTMNITTSVTPSVSVTSDHGAVICAGTMAVFTAAPIYGGGSPVFIWKTNGVQDTSVSSSSVTYTNTELADGDMVDCQLISNDPCASPTIADATQIVMAVNPNVPPSVSISANPGSTICSNSSVTFTATPVNGGASPTYQWKTNGVSTGATSSTFTTSLLKNGDVVTVVMTPSADICVSPATVTPSGITMTVNQNVAPTVNVSANPSGAICAGSSVTFTASPVNGGTTPAYQWRTNGVPVAGATSSTFTTATLVNGDVVTVVVTPSPDICVSPATATSANLTISVNSFRLVLATALTENMGTPGVTTVVNSYTGWQSTPPLTFSSTSTAQSDVRTSASSTGYLGASGGGNVFFGTASGADRNLIIAGINTTGFVSPQLQFGLDKVASGSEPFVVEVSSDGVDWTALTVPQPAALNTWTLTTASGTIPSTPNLSIRFSKNSTTAQYRLDDVKLSDVSTSASIGVSGPTTFCAGGSVTLTASAGGSSYVWSTGETTPSITVSVSDTYTVTVFDANTCSSSASETVTVNPLPAVSVNSTTVCAGDSTTLTATTDASDPTYLWSPGGATTASINVSPISTTLYSVAVADGATMCVNNASGTVTVNPLPAVGVNSATVCAGGSATLTATTSAGTPSYLWSPGGATTAAITVSPAGTTVYSVTVTDGTTGCASSGSGTVTVNPLPTVAILPATTNAECASTVTFTADPAGDGPLTYQWYDNLTNAIVSETNLTLTVTNLHDAAAGNYTVVVTGPFCSASAIASLTVKDTLAPILTILGANPATNECHVADTDAGVIANDICVGEVSVTTNSAVNTDAPGVYAITYTSDDGNGNTNTATRMVYVVDTIAPTLTVSGANPATIECHAAYTDAGATASDACMGLVVVTTSGSVDANTPGSYTLTYTADDSNGNTNSATRTVYVADTIAPVISMFGANPYTNFAYVLFVDPGATAVDACDISAAVTTNGTVDVATPGSYALQYVSTDASGNSTTNTRTVEVIALESPTITSEQQLGSGAFEVTFTGPNGQPYQLVTSPDVTLPMSGWTVLTTGMFGGNPVIYTDATAVNDAVRFYRIVSP